MLSLSIIILSVVAGAVADALNEKNKDLGHLVEPIEKPILIIIGVVCGWWAIISYAAFRVALFDPVKNLVKGDPILYQGDIGWWDKFLSKQHKWGIVFGRVIFLAFAVFFTLRTCK